MIARPYYSWDLKNNINNDKTIILEVDIEILEKIRRTVRSTIQDLAFSDNYEHLKEVIDQYLKLEQLSAIYYQKEKEQKKEEEQNNDVLSEAETAEQ